VCGHFIRAEQWFGVGSYREILISRWQNEGENSNKYHIFKTVSKSKEKMVESENRCI
jgi:hypothetical protein